ncbi:hypothetical protein NQ314_003452 [Rhamnusium bicolor]|uniref:Uncharacterized protein n=1 Tax=Rhamnusium bicolor TaxID=1586634 RepID=A0AAV8ZP43_9CUCU|nr:hypothetical protein NQ314_003452 [Rhamnusium bicolor]
MYAFFSDGLVEGMAWMTVNKDSLHYNMMHKSQGIAYIFNHQTFDTKKCLERHGTDVDARKLSNCLEALGFDVLVFKDLKLAEIIYHVNQAVIMDHTNYNCFLLIVLSHGDQVLLYARDEPYNPDEILWDQFTADKCPTLAGKPKLFLLQSCQGLNTDPGIKLVQRPVRTETDGQFLSYRIPIYADFLIIYATFKGHYAFRNRGAGSYFITVLCEELEKLAYKENLLTILTIVNRRVAVEFESNHKDPDKNDKKQIPYFKSSLTRLVQFLDITNAITD